VVGRVGRDSFQYAQVKPVLFEGDGFENGYSQNENCLEGESTLNEFKQPTPLKKKKIVGRRRCCSLMEMVVLAAIALSHAYLGSYQIRSARGGRGRLGNTKGWRG
jgi:hypothetical protein